MDPQYQIKDTNAIFSPALLFYKDRIAQNLRRMVAIAGSPDRLRPHVKTHKTREIVRMALALGVTKHKCATLAEAEMLADCGVQDLVIAYPIVGPNCERLAKLVQAFPASQFGVLADHPVGVQQLSAALSAAHQTVEVILDVNVGQNRTGVAPGDAAIALYESLTKLAGVRPGGLHLYDGHNHQPALPERVAAVKREFSPAWELRDALRKKGLPVPRLIMGGTPTFPVHAKLDFPEVELSPGTCVLSDYNYGNWFPDLEIVPATLLLTRVVSRPTPNRVTFDLGYKAVASDPPAGSRCVLWDVPDAKAVIHNEEHFVVETAAAERFRPGDVAYAQPAHICPTCALHKFAYVIENGAVVDRWEIVARDRILQF
jgi:D-serine deaminase-like pyridoxal phosphate-dependent protein